MEINRRRSPSPQISRSKKLGGHKKEKEYANLIKGEIILGTKKGDVKDQEGKLHSVKSGKKWQLCLYSKKRISNCSFLKELLPSLNAFPDNYDDYTIDRTKCIHLKEKYVRERGREYVKKISNDEIKKILGENSYIIAKEKLAEASAEACEKLKNKDFLRNFLSEVIFNNEEVDFLAIKDTHYKKDNFFKVFFKNDVLDILTEKLKPDISRAGKVPEDYNVNGQKTLLLYKKKDRWKNIVEIEIRNERPEKYRLLRCNMYSHDALNLLLNNNLNYTSSVEGIQIYGQANNFLLV